MNRARMLLRLQAEDRIRRIGQKSQVIRSLWLTAFSIDDKIDKLLQAKDKSSRQVLDEQGLYYIGLYPNFIPNIFHFTLLFDDIQHRKNRAGFQNRLLQR